MKRLIVVAVLPWMLAACKPEVAEQEAVKRPAMVFVVGTLAADAGNVYSGEIHARYETVLGFRIGGKIIQRLVDAGSVVRKGQTLARLDDSDPGLQESAAAAQLQLARDELQRYKELRQQGFVSQSALDAKVTALTAAEAQAGLARNQATYTSLLADRDGVVSATFAEVGQVLGPGQPVVRVAQHGEREVAISIPESRYTSVRVGMPADVSLVAAGSSRDKVSGHVREVSPAADAASRTYPVRVALDARNTSLALGMTAYVTLGTSAKRKDEYLIPMTALFQQGDKDAVWMVGEDHSVSLRPVTVAAYRDDGVLVSGGLSRGERIIKAGVHKLVSGEKVQPVEDGVTK